MLGPMPAYGFYARNSRAITLSNVRFEVQTPELRPALILDRVEDAAINGLSVEGNAESESALRPINTRQALITAPRVLKRAKVFLQVEGQESSGIIVDGGDLSKAETVLAFNSGAENGSVKLRGD